MAEAYWRVVLNEYFALTADLQYMKERYNDDPDDIDGIIAGIRMTTEF